MPIADESVIQSLTAEEADVVEETLAFDVVEETRAYDIMLKQSDCF